MPNKVFSKNAFRQKNIIISGGAGDIGIEIAMEFSKAGANKIALLDNDVEQLNKAVSVLKNIGGDAVKIEVDLSDEHSIENSVKGLYEKADHWDILITTAGMFIGGTLTDYKANDWDTLMKINARSVFLLSRLIAKKMIVLGRGKIIHIGSSSTYYGTPGSGVD